MTSPQRPSQPPYPSHAPPPGPYGPPGPQPAPRGKSGTGRTCLTVAMCVVGSIFLLIGIGGGAVTFHLSRNIEPSAAYRANAWHNLPADRFFPDKLTDEHLNGYSSYWARLGIDQQTDCAGPLSKKFASFVTAHGCRAVLRATYVDASRWTVGTVTVIVTKTPAQADQVGERLVTYQEAEELRHPLHTYRVPGTIAAHFTDGHSNGMVGGATDPEMPYAVGVTVGASDGRVAGHLKGDWNSGDASQRLDRDGWQKDASDLARRMSAQIYKVKWGHV